MKLLISTMLLLASLTIYAQGSRQYRSCINDAQDITLQLLAGPGSYGMTTADDVRFATIASGDRFDVYDAEMTSEENEISKTITENGTTTIIVTELSMRFELENGKVYDEHYTCMEVQYTP